MPTNLGVREAVSDQNGGRLFFNQSSYFKDQKNTRALAEQITGTHFPRPGHTNADFRETRNIQLHREYHSG